MIADGPAEHRIAGFQCIKDGPYANRTVHFELDLPADAGEGAEVKREDDADHESVCTSTDSTGGKSRTIGCQLSPESGEQ